MIAFRPDLLARRLTIAGESVVRLPNAERKGGARVFYALNARASHASKDQVVTTANPRPLSPSGPVIIARLRSGNFDTGSRGRLRQRWALRDESAGRQCMYMGGKG